MEEIREKKREIRSGIASLIAGLSKAELKKKTLAVKKRLFEFANFLEAKIPLLYVNTDDEVDTRDIIKTSYSYNKIVVLPAFNKNNREMTFYKVDDLETELKIGVREVAEPDPEQCKIVPVDRVDIAIIPAIALDEKGGRIGTGRGYYDRIIPKLAATTRKVALAFEEQIIAQVPMQSHDKHVDIIITDERVIYKI